MTSFDTIIEIFLDNMIKNPDYFIYDGVGEAEAKILLEKESTDLLKRALSFIMSKHQYDVSFDYDVNTRTVAGDLNNKEINLVVDAMYVMYLSNFVPSLKPTTNYFSTMDLKLFSPANERSTYEKMYKSELYALEENLDNYCSRDRTTGAIKSITFPSVSGVI